MIGAPRNLLTVWSRLIAASLVAAGVRDVVVSPGSRSTPFLLALHARPELRLTSVIDERAAAFVALGMARATGVPAATLATSGTAPAHWYPAVIEASLAGVPLILLSANRPVAMTHAGAAQTIDQSKLFGDWARLFVDLGDPSPERAALEGVVRRIGQAVAVATHPDAPGPVHVDLHADKPLESVEPSTEDEQRLLSESERALARAVTRVSHGAKGADETFARELASALSVARRPLVIAGPRRERHDAAAILDACARLSLVVCAEATSQLRFASPRALSLDASEVVFSSDRFLRASSPDLVLQIGALPTAPTLERVGTSAVRLVLDAGGIHDPIGGARAISTGPAGATLARAAELCPRVERDDAWVNLLRRADGIAWAEVERSIADRRGEGATVRAALAAAPGATLVIGNSLPIRTLDRFVPGGGSARLVLSQRGANGIDGLVSGALGAAIASAAPLLAVVGDVSFVHDVNVLSAMSQLRTPLVVVVIDNDGGRIFESLPIARVASMADVMPLFTTPHGVELATAVRAFGVNCVETVDAAETGRAVAAAIDRAGATIVRAKVDPHDARRSFDALARAFDQTWFGAVA